MSKEKVKIMRGFEESLEVDENGKPRPLKSVFEIAKSEYDRREKVWKERMEAMETIRGIMEAHNISARDLDEDCDLL